MPSRFLTALPVFNERQHVEQVLAQVTQFAEDVLVVDDGSTDGTAECLAEFSDLHVVTHTKNQGYGAALRTAFDFSQSSGLAYHF